MLPPVYKVLAASNDVRAIVGTKIYRHGRAPQDVEDPRITWFAITVAPDNNLSDPPTIDKFPLQIDCWHQTDAGVEKLAKAVRDAIEPHAHMISLPVDSRDDDSKLYRMTLQFDWWKSRKS